MHIYELSQKYRQVKQNERYLSFPTSKSRKYCGVLLMVGATLPSESSFEMRREKIHVDLFVD
jgi:hypothetical protein